MRRTLITGAAGFVGANVARRMVADGHHVTLLLKEGTNSWRLEDLLPHVEVLEVDLSDRDAVDSAMTAARPDWIFHLAAHGAYSTQLDAAEMVRTNIVGTAHLVDAAVRLGCEAMVNTGSSSEYGFKDHAPAESEALEPNSHYSVTKAAATMYCRFTARHTGMHLPTLRLYSVYGPWEEPTRLMPAVVVRGLAGALPPLVDPTIARDYVYVDDVCDAYVLAASVPGQEAGSIYNVGTGTQSSLAMVVDTARGLLDIASEPEWGSMQARKWDTDVWVADNRAIVQALGWKPRRDLVTGMAAVADWFRSSPSMLTYYNDRMAAPV